MYFDKIIINDNNDKDQYEYCLGWVRIELEPVNVPLEQDESILLSAIQSVIPGAHGLYYKDEDCKKALKSCLFIFFFPPLFSLSLSLSLS